MSEQRQTDQCDRCGDEYETYVVIVNSETGDLTEYKSEMDKNFCKPCRMVVADYGEYLTEYERSNIEPKLNV